MEDIQEALSDDVSLRATFWPRVAAFIIDLAVVSIATSILIFPVTLFWKDYFFKLPASMFTLNDCEEITELGQIADGYYSYLQQQAKNSGVENFRIVGKVCTYRSPVQKWTVTQTTLHRMVDGKLEPFFNSNYTQDGSGAPKYMFDATGAAMIALPLYFAFLQARPGHASIGKRILKLRYARLGGEPRFWRLVTRYIVLIGLVPWVGFAIVVSLSYVATGGLWAQLETDAALFVMGLLSILLFFAFIRPFLGKKKSRRMIHDKLFGTEVLRAGA